MWKIAKSEDELLVIFKGREDHKQIGNPGTNASFSSFFLRDMKKQVVEKKIN